MPDLSARTAIHGPDFVASRDVNDAVHFDGHGLQAPGMCLEGPSQGERTDIFAIDLCERTVAPTRVIAVVSRPSVCRRLLKFFGIEALRRQAR